MKDEIKEILNRFASLKEASDRASYYPEDLLTREDMWILYDYITNLEEELKSIKENYKIQLEYDEQLEKWYCNRTDCSGRIKDSKKYDSLQQRIDKAIAYIKNICCIQPNEKCNIDLRYDEVDYLLNILRGENEDIK